MANIVVTGASRGLGLEFVKQLAKFSNSPKIIALCRDPENAEKLRSVASSCPNINIIQADMTDFDGYSNIVTNIQHQITGGGINLLINNAGVMIKDTVRNVTKKNVIDSFELNSLAPLLFTKALLPLLKSADSSTFHLNDRKSVVMNISAHLGSIEENITGGCLSYRISKTISETLLEKLNQQECSATILSQVTTWIKWQL